MADLTTITGKDRIFNGVTNSGTTDISEFVETLTDFTQSGNACTLDFTSGNVFYFTGTAFGANYTVNLTNVPTSNGKATVFSIIHTQDSTGYYPSTLNINGASATIKWLGGAVPTPTNSGLDVFTFTILRRGDAFEVLGSSQVAFASV